MDSNSPCFHPKWKKISRKTSGKIFPPCLECTVSRIESPQFCLSKWRTKFPPVLSAQFQESHCGLCLALFLREMGQHSALLWAPKLKRSHCWTFSHKKWAALRPALSAFLKILLLQNFLGKKWAAFRPALSPKLQRSHGRSNCIGEKWAAFLENSKGALPTKNPWKNWAACRPSQSRVNADHTHDMKKSSILPSRATKFKDRIVANIFSGKNCAAFRPVLRLKIWNRMVANILLGKIGQHFVLLWACVSKDRMNAKFSWEKMGSISPCFEPKTPKTALPQQFYWKKWAAFRPAAPNLKIQRRLASKKSLEKLGSISPLAKPNTCRPHTWYEKKAASCPPAPRKFLGKNV